MFGTYTAQKGRVPPLKHYIWRLIGNTLFDDDTLAIGCSDGATAYSQVLRGIIERYAVNHSIQEWTRPVQALFNVDTQERRGTLASSNFIDSDWRKIKKQVPDGISVSTLGGVKTKMMYVRCAQWRMMVRGEGRGPMAGLLQSRWSLEAKPRPH